MKIVNLLLKFLQDLFAEKISFPLGAFKSPTDVRNILITSVQAPIVIPPIYKTDLSALPVENQQQIPDCVAQAITKLKQLYIYRATGQVVNLVCRALYKWCKDVDGIPGQMGTFPAVGAKMATSRGIPSDDVLSNDHSLAYSQFLAVPSDQNIIDSALKNKFAGYAFVPANFDAIKQAIYQNGAVVGSTDVDTNWFTGIIGKIFKSVGRHYTLWYGYDTEGIFARNHWSNSWIAKFFNKLFPAGDFYFKWDDYKANVYDIIAFVDIPEDMLKKVKTTPYKFMNTLTFGMVGPEIQQLQNALNALGYKLSITGSFDLETQNAVKDFQVKHGLPPVGQVGPQTRALLNGGTSKIDLWCEAAKHREGWITPADKNPRYPNGSASYRNNNPGNIIWIGQPHATQNGRFAKFDTYEHGYEYLKNFLIRACSGQSHLYNPDADLYAFYSGIPPFKQFPGYAPASDNNDPKSYAEEVASHIGVPPTTPIKNLLY